MPLPPRSPLSAVAALRPPARPPRCAPLSSLDEAKALVDLVYEAAGLGYPQPWMYQPEAILALNRRGAVRSLLAMEGARVVGHAALIQPWLELQPPGAAPIAAAAVAEVGLAVVAPRRRGGALQGALGAALYEDGVRRGVLGVISRCAAHQDRGQRGAAAAGGAAVGLLLGGAPRGAGRDPRAPAEGLAASEMLYYTPLSSIRPASSLGLPEGFGFVAPQARALGLRRGPPAPAERGPSTLLCSWSAERGAATVLVPRLGEDLLERLGQTLGWLQRGPIGHISVALAADTDGLVGLGPALRGLGLSAAGWLPGFFDGGRDAALLQALAWRAPDLDAVIPGEPGAAALSAAVIADWRLAQGRAAEAQRRQGAVVVSLHDARPGQGQPAARRWA